MENTGIQPVMPIGNMGYGDGFGYGGCWMWIIVLFALMGGGFGGWNNRGDVASTRDVYASNDNQTLNANVRDLNNSMFRLGNGISDATFALNNTVVNGFNNTGRDIANGTYVLDKAITDTRYVLGNGINENRFASQQNANMIAQAIANDGEKTRALIVQNKIEELQGRLAEKDRLLQTRDFELSQCYQTNNIKTDVINAVRPFPVPAFAVGNPYGTGCNCSCGCYNA